MSYASFYHHHHEDVIHQASNFASTTLGYCKPVDACEFDGVDILVSDALMLHSITITMIKSCIIGY